jgi:hypothetical protein
MTRLITTLALIAFGGCAAFAARALSVPLPFMLGPLVAVAALVCTPAARMLPGGYRFPQSLRQGFIAIIGLMIGAQVSPELFQNAPRLMLSIGALTAFVLLALGGELPAVPARRRL